MKSPINKKVVLTIFLSSLVVFLDQVSKHLVVSKKESFFEGIDQVLPGEIIKYKDNKLSFQRYYNLSEILNLNKP